MYLMVCPSPPRTAQSYEGEEFQIIPQYDYPVSNIFFSQAPSPRIQWRSAKTTSGNIPQQTLSIKLNPDTATSLIGSPSQ